jgi:hypothetical protein
MDSELLRFVDDSDLDGPTTSLIAGGAVNSAAAAPSRTKEPALFDKLLHLAGAESGLPEPEMPHVHSV